MEDKVQYYVHCEFQHELKDYLKQLKELMQSPNYCMPGQDQIPASLAAVISASVAAALSAAKSSTWCKNINQNGVANNSNIMPGHK